MQENSKDYTKMIETELEVAVKLLAFEGEVRARVGVPEDQNSELFMSIGINLSESREYLESIYALTETRSLRSAGAILRCLLESTANINWILHNKQKTDARSKKYVASIKKYSEFTALVGKDGKISERIPKIVAQWTRSSEETRILTFSPHAGRVYDFCSHFTHASPSSQHLYGDVDKILYFIVSQANVYFITSRALINYHTSFFTETESLHIQKVSIQMSARTN